METSFDCPHCGAYAGQTWGTLHVRREHANPGDEEFFTVTPFVMSTCQGCGDVSLWRSGSPDDAPILWPTGMVGPEASPDLPDSVAAIYQEARHVAGASPRSAAALLRLALEGVLEGLYPEDAGNLNRLVGAAAKAGLPENVVNAMDVLRFNGNAAAHEVHLDDTSATVAALFDVLNLVVDRLIGEPKRIATLYADLPDTVRAQAERRDSRSPDSATE